MPTKDEDEKKLTEFRKEFEEIMATPVVEDLPAAPATPALNKAEVRTITTNSGCILKIIEERILEAWRPVRVGEHFKFINRVNEQEFWLVAGKETWEVWASGDAYCNDDTSARMDKEHVLFEVLKNAGFSANGIIEIEKCFYQRMDIAKGQKMNPESTPMPTLSELADITDKLARACVNEHEGRDTSVSMMAEHHLEKTRTRNVGGLPGFRAAGFEIGTTHLGGSRGQTQNPEAAPMPPSFGGIFSKAQAEEAEKVRSPLVQFLAEELTKYDPFSVNIQDAEVIGQRIYAKLYNNTDIREERILKFATDLTAEILEYLVRTKTKPIFINVDAPDELPASSTELDPEQFDLQAASSTADLDAPGIGRE